MSELHSLSVVKMRQGLLKKDFSATDLARAHLQRIEATNSRFNSFITICEKEALEQSERADGWIRERGAKSPALTGIPIAIKDMIVTEGIRTTCASKMLSNFIPPYDSTAVQRLKQHGAVILGKTNMDEFAMGSSNEHSCFGPCRNPWDAERVPGGSSGGSATAVALGQAPLALGTDTGGSIRQPASLTGTVGMLPTYGRVSRYGAVAFASSLDQIGPFARSVDDLALCLEAICGHDQNDSTSMKIEVPEFYNELQKHDPSNLKGLRVGVPKQFFGEGADPEVAAKVMESIDRLASLGATLVDIELPHAGYALAVYYIIAPAEASSNLARYDGIRYGFRAEGADNLIELYAKSRAQGFGSEVKRRIMIGAYVLSAGYYDAYYRKAQEVRTLIKNDFRAAFHNSCDVIAAPVSPTTAFRIGEKSESPMQMYLNDTLSIPLNLSGVPGLSVPIGADSKGLPIGLQLIGAPFNESLLLRVGKAAEQSMGFDVRAKTTGGC